MLGERLGTNGESDGQDGGHGNWNSTDQEDEDVIQATTIGVLEASIENEDFSNDEDPDRDQTEGTDLGKNLLQVTCRVIVLSNERSGTTEEGVGTSRNNNTLSFTLFARRSAVDETSVPNGQNRRKATNTHEKH